MAEAQGLSLSLAVVDAVDESEGAGEGLREGAGEPEGPIVVEGLEDADSALERVAVGSGERHSCTLRQEIWCRSAEV